MVFQRKKVASALGVLLGVGGIGAVTAPALAQDIKVDVTGTNIRRVEAETALPVTVITREEIDQTGVRSTQDLLQYITAATSSGNFNSTTVIGATTFGLQTASLRGLGGARTLVLLNGRRIGGFSGDQLNGQSVNLTSIPFTAIERVEVLRDGASAIYGTDAIAGVINFILRKDYRGAEATVYYGAPTRGTNGGGTVTDVSGTVGWGDLAKDRWNFMLNASWHQEQEVYGRDRDFARTSIIPSIGLFGFSGNTFPATITAPAGFPSIGTRNPTFPNCAPSQINTEFFPGRCLYDPAVDAQIIPEVETSSFYGVGRFQFNPNWQAFVSAAFTKSENHNIIQPVPLSDIFNDPIILQPSSPYYPLAYLQQNFPTFVGNPVNVRYRSVLTGNRDITDTNEAWQVVAGVEGSWRNWDIAAAVFYNETEVKEVLNGGFPRLSLVVPLLNSGRVNFFGPTPPDVAAEVNATNFVGEAFRGTTKLYGADAKASAEVWKLPAGPLAVAFGGEVRKEEITNTPNSALQTGDISGYGGAFEFINKDRDVWALFAEANIPIVKNLELNLAVRHDDYSDFGGTTNPKVSLRWQPDRRLLLRTAWGTGFLAPSLQQLFLPQRAGVTQAGVDDPLRCPTTNDSQDCLTQFNVLFGGNPALKPEKSRSFTAGIVWEPIAPVSLTVDYFNIEVKDLIVAGLPTLTILGDLNQFGNLVTRGPVQANFPQLPGPITEINQLNINLGKVRTEGLDIDLQLRSEQTSAGRFTFRLNGTYFINYETQNVDGSFSNNINTVLGQAVTGVIPRWKHYATLSWNRGPWGASLSNTWQSSYTDAQTDLDDLEREVSSLSIWDTQVTYTGFKNWKLMLGVKNLFNRNPPLTNQQYTFQSGYDPSYYDARARFVYGAVTYAFKP